MLTPCELLTSGWSRWDPDKTPVLEICPFNNHGPDHNHCEQFTGGQPWTHIRMLTDILVGVKLTLNTCSSSSVTSSASKLFPLCRAITFSTVPTSERQTNKKHKSKCCILPPFVLFPSVLDVSFNNYKQNSVWPTRQKSGFCSHDLPFRQACYMYWPVPMNMTSYCPSSASTLSTTICFSL